MVSTSMNILAIGASRNIGYLSTTRLLDAGATVTFVLRSPSCFDGDESIQKHVNTGKAHLVKGDALNQSDVRRGWEEALKHGNVDLLLFTVGGTPDFHLTKGFVINPPNLVTQCLMNCLTTLPSPHPKIVVVSSSGLTKASHEALPVLLKPMYAWLLASPHRDKVGAEKLLSHCCANMPWDPRDGEPDVEIMGSDNWTQREDLPAAGSLSDILVVRPAFLTDGKCVADMGKGKQPYRASEKDIGGYTLSRKDVAHFIVDAVLNRWDEVKDKRITIAY